MADFKETNIGCLDVDDFATFCSSERKWINKIMKLRDARPDEVKIIEYPDDNNGVLLAHVPKSWMKISPPKKVNWTEEQRAAAAERLNGARKKKQ